jgi:hypothetical protein
MEIGRGGAQDDPAGPVSIFRVDTSRRFSVTLHSGPTHVSTELNSFIEAHTHRDIDHDELASIT